MRRKPLVLYAGVIVMLAGCGGGEDSGAAAGQDGASARNVSGPPPTLDAVLACMKREGLDAENQSTSSGAKIAVDYPAGRLIVSFEDSSHDAERTASLARTQHPAATTVRSGTIVISSSADRGAQVGRPVAEDCVRTS